MKAKLFKGIATACLALSIAVAGTGVPAQAAETRTAPTAAAPQMFAFDWVSLVVTVAGYMMSGSGGGGALEAAVAEIKAAIAQARTEIIAQIDAIAAAEVEACLEAHTIEFLNIDFMDEYTLRAWAQNATSCATQASAFANAVQSPNAVDKIGYVIGPIFAIVLAARAQAGFLNGTDLVVQSQIRAYEAVVTKLTPTDCQIITVSEGSAFYEKWWRCVAYNGNVGRSGSCFGRNCVPNRATAENQATANTSRPIAVVSLPRLRSLGV